MMREIFKLSIFLLALTVFTACGTGEKQDSRQALESGFITPPDSMQTGVYWYWISDNISKEGVINDLHAMKKAGINRAFIGNIGQDDVPYGTAKILVTSGGIFFMPL
jgi:hypothetical protein